MTEMSAAEIDNAIQAIYYHRTILKKRLGKLGTLHRPLNGRGYREVYVSPESISMYSSSKYACVVMDGNWFCYLNSTLHADRHNDILLELNKIKKYWRSLKRDIRPLTDKLKS